MDLPINKQQAAKVSNWLATNFSQNVQRALSGTSWSFQVVAAIACKETAYKWLYWIDSYTSDIVLQRCVFDASGEPEFKNNPRNVFPKDRFDFEHRYGKDFLAILVAEGNKQRSMPQPGAPKGYKPGPYLYKGYGIFQYDLQAVVKDEDFFKLKQWYSIDECLKRLVNELNEKQRIKEEQQQEAILKDIVTAYNGAGPKAVSYGESVMQYLDWV